MSSFWRRVNRLLIVLLSAFAVRAAFAGPYADLDASLKGRSDAEAVAGLRRIAGEDEDAQAALEAGPRSARAYVAVRASLEGAPPTKPPPIAVASGDGRIASSWLSRALGRLHAPEFDSPEPRLGPGVGIGPWATTLMWGVLGAVLLTAVYLLARNVRLPAKKRKAIVDEEEPLRSSDAWIDEANGLVSQGRYREAVRGLYVAGLMRFDEANVARFDRHQTNWEHLRRIEASSRKPEGVDARVATGLFDRCWYGRLNVTAEDAAAMRAWYDTLVAKLTEAAAS